MKNRKKKLNTDSYKIDSSWIYVLPHLSTAGMAKSHCKMSIVDPLKAIRLI